MATKQFVNRTVFGGSSSSSASRIIFTASRSAASVTENLLSGHLVRLSNLSRISVRCVSSAKNHDRSGDRSGDTLGNKGGQNLIIPSKGHNPLFTLSPTSLSLSTSLTSNEHNLNQCRFFFSNQKEGNQVAQYGSNNQPATTTAQKTPVVQKLLGVTTAGYAVVKFLPGLKFAIPLLKLAKMGPLLSMGLTTLAYGAIFGPVYGVGMVGLLFSSQLGTALARRRLGLPVEATTFIPFLGVTSGGSNDEHFKPSYDVDGNPVYPSAYRDSLLAIAGPAFSLMTSVVPFSYAMFTGAQIGFALADFGLLLTFISLLPVGSLPGGTLVGALHRYTLPVGLAALGSFLCCFPTVSPVFWLLFLLSGWRTYRVFFPDDLEIWRRKNNYYDTNQKQKLILGGGYVFMLFCTLTLMSINAKYKKDPRELRRQQREERMQEALVMANVNALKLKDPNNVVGMNTQAYDPELLGISESEIMRPEANSWNVSEWALNSLDSWENEFE